MNVNLDYIVFWLQRAGGISTYFYELSNYLASRSDITLQNVLQAQPCKSVYAEWLETINGSYDNRPLVFARYGKTPVADKEPGVFHSSYYRRPQSTHLANVVTVYDFTYEYFRKGVARLVHCQQKYSAIRSADIVICISEHTKKDLLRFVPDVNPDRIRVVPLAASSKFTVNTSPDSPLNVCGGRPFALYVGDRRGYKRFDLAVAGVRLHKELALVIVGGQLTGTRAGLLERYLPGRWHYAGQISNDELNRFYNAAHVFLYPSEYEGFGIPVLEAMQAGCPVICSNFAALPETAGNAAILVRTPVGNAYAEALSKLDSPVTRNAMIQRGLEHAAAFTWGTCCARTFDAYKDAIANKYSF